jgi:hypothetical protein
VSEAIGGRRRHQARTHQGAWQQLRRTRHWSRPPTASAALPPLAAAQRGRCYAFRGQGLGATFLRLHHSFFLLAIGRGGARKTRRLITLLSVGWLPPSWPPSGACLMLRPSVPCSLVTLPRVAPHRGCAFADGRENLGVLWLQTSSQLYAFGVTATCLAIAHIKALHARAMATTT